MKNLYTILLILIVQSSFAQLNHDENIGNWSGKEVELPSKLEFRSFGEMWYSTIEDMMNDGSIPGTDEIAYFPVVLFPDSTIFVNFDNYGNPIESQIHGMADLINPSRIPSDYLGDWKDAQVVVDSIEIPFMYYRETDTSIVDTVFIDYLNHISLYERVSWVNLDGNGTPNENEFINQPLLHYGESEMLADEMFFRTDTFYLTQDDEIDQYPRSMKFDVNDTLPAGKRYGLYVRFRPGYDWVANDDTLDHYNIFATLMREQVKGERPEVLWDPYAAIGSYLCTKSTRYNYGAFDSTLTIGFSGSGKYPYEHAMFRYKLTSNALSVYDDFSIGALKVFPNPSNGILNLTIENPTEPEYLIQLFNQLGKLVYSADEALLSAQVNHQIYTGDLVPGVYHLSVNGFVIKVVVK